MSQRSGRGENDTRSVAMDMVTKSLVNRSRTTSRGGDHKCSGENQANTEEDGDFERFDDFVERVRQHALIDSAPGFDGAEHAHETTVGEDDPRGGLGHIGRCGNSDACFSLFQGRGVIHAVTRHTDDVSLPLKRLNQTELIFRKNSGEDVIMTRRYPRAVAQALG